MAQGFDWGALLRAGIQGLGLRPAEFWALTPSELRAMLGEGRGGDAISRGRLNELLTLFPDDGGTDDGAN